MTTTYTTEHQQVLNILCGEASLVSPEVVATAIVEHYQRARLLEELGHLIVSLPQGEARDRVSTVALNYDIASDADCRQDVRDRIRRQDRW
jgi:hypothetical protein